MADFVKRNYTFEIRANDEGGAKIVGRPIVYDARFDLGGGWYETIAKGALDGADLSDVFFFVNHDISKIPLARAREAFDQSTMRFIVDDAGMVIEVDLDIENNADARALYSAVKRGDITGMSFMFSIEAEERDDAKKRYTIIRIGKVVEVSAVNFPAYEATEISARSKEVQERTKETVDKASLELALLKAKILYNI